MFENMFKISMVVIPSFTLVILSTIQYVYKFYISYDTKIETDKLYQPCDNNQGWDQYIIIDE